MGYLEPGINVRELVRVSWLSCDYLLDMVDCLNVQGPFRWPLYFKVRPFYLT